MAVSQQPQPGIVLTPEQIRGRRNRNVAIAVSITLFAVMIFVVTLAKLGANVLNRPM